MTAQEAIEVLFAERHSLGPDVLRSIQHIWHCASAARYDGPYEAWDYGPDFYADHDTAECEDDTADLADPPGDARGFPPIVCLCGSTRFYDQFQQANYELTMRGAIVLSVGFYSRAKARPGTSEGVRDDSAAKVALDELHKRKIDLADYVLVLNPGGYIGKSTRSEIAYAAAHGKPVRYLEAPEQVRPQNE
jgi:hypothetical protein